MLCRFSLPRRAVCVLVLFCASPAVGREYLPDELTSPLPAPTSAPSDQVPTEVAPSQAAPIVEPSPAVEPVPPPILQAQSTLETPSDTRKPTINVTKPNRVNSGEALQLIVRRLKMPLPLPQSRIIIIKSARLLELWNGATLIKRYRVALGANPRSPKQRRGDNRTPEGRFSICTRNARTSAFHIFLGLSYPDVPDIERGLRQRQISPREYQLSRRRLASRATPLWETRLGGWVGIHGGDDAAFATRRRQQRKNADWTAGCIALSNREIEEIFAATRLGTPVEIRP